MNEDFWLGVISFFIGIVVLPAGYFMRKHDTLKAAIPESLMICGVVGILLGLALILDVH